MHGQKKKSIKELEAELAEFITNLVKANMISAWITRLIVH
jgi:hypothetical protein